MSTSTDENATGSDTGTRTQPRLQTRYREEIVPALQEQFALRQRHDTCRG